MSIILLIFVIQNIRMEIITNGQSASKPLLNGEGSTTIPLGSTKKEIQDFFGKGWLTKYPGIYQIVNRQNNKIYIGGTLDLRERLANHISELRNNRHHSIYLQRAFNKYGIDSFYFEILELCEPDWNIIEKLEQGYFEKYRETFVKNTYNILNISNRGFSKNHSEETILKIVTSMANIKKICWYKNKTFIKCFSRIGVAIKETGFSKTCIYESCKSRRYVTKKGDCFCFEEDRQDLETQLENLKFVPWNKSKKI